tara:strand:+ start:80484 stop:80795 length:312 start_codon:yes stop_codon:yes gene_type:complete
MLRGAKLMSKNKSSENRKGFRKLDAEENLLNQESGYKDLQGLSSEEALSFIDEQNKLEDQNLVYDAEPTVEELRAQRTADLEEEFGDVGNSALADALSKALER